MDTEVLIAGAGPTGLTLALWLRHLGVESRIVDKDAGPGETSRALAVQTRTLEFHRQIGIADEVIAAGIEVATITVRSIGRIAAHIDVKDIGAGLSYFPCILALPQDVHERILIARLEKLGVTVERRTELTAFAETGDGIVATLVRDGATETVKAAYLCGSDGPHSTVRHGLKLGFPGGAYPQMFYVADIAGSGPVVDGGLDVCLGRYGFVITLPVRQTNSIRVIGIVPKEFEDKPQVDFEDVREAIIRDSGVEIGAVNWFSTYHVHHRVADHFRVGRAFVLGDAGHIHSPAGGQGMNTGMGDAVNLAWKLAAVLQERADPRLLDSYETERIAFARLLIESTDKAFRFVTSPTALGTFVRRLVLPNLAALAMRIPSMPRILFNTISQIRINYRASPISAGSAGSLRAGDRLPYVGDTRPDNFAPLKSLDWQVHVYGEPGGALSTALGRAGIPLHVFPWSKAAETAGIPRDAALLIRPDGHIAVAGRATETAPFERYLADWKIRPRDASK